MIFKKMRLTQGAFAIALASLRARAKKFSPMLFLLFTSLAVAAPTTTQELYEVLRAKNPQTRAEALAALPEEMKKNFVLMKRSRSRQKGRPELPRVMHFSKDASFIATSSGHEREKDIAANNLETMELDRETGEWKFFSLPIAPLAPPILEDRACMGCHGQNPRPLWGEFGNWPDAYGGDLGAAQPDEMSPAEFLAFQTFLANAGQGDYYRHLQFTSSPQGFRLPETSFALPNAAFTARLGARQAEAIGRRAARHPQFARFLPAYLHLVLACPRSPTVETNLALAYQERLTRDAAFAREWAGLAPEGPLTRALRLLDLDPVREFRLDTVPRFRDDLLTENQVVGWKAGPDSLTDLVILYLLPRAGLDLPRLLGPEKSALLARTHQLVFATSSSALQELDQKNPADYRYSLFPDIRQRVFSIATTALCPQLESLSARLF